MVKILVDTNIILYGASHKLDVLEKLKDLGEPVVLACVFRELENLAKSNKSAKRNAKLALEILKKRDIAPAEHSKHAMHESADKMILLLAKEHGYAVATNDAKLVKDLKKNMVKVIRLRQKRYFLMN